MKVLLVSLLISFGAMSSLNAQAKPQDPNFTSFELDSLMTQLNATERPWLGFFQGENVLTGIYHLKAGAEDGQKPHGTDEVYYVASGKGQFTADGETVSIQPGSILFVKAEVEHRFHDIAEDLVLVVFFDR